MKSGVRAQSATPAFKRAIIIVLALLILAALTACDVTSLAGLPIQVASSSSSPTPTVPGASDRAPSAPSAPGTSGDSTAPGASTPVVPGAPSASTIAAVKAVIQKANQEEVQAFASNDPSVMSDTATPAYYQQMAQDYTDMASSGITSIQLVNLTWGPVTLQGANTAQANTTETWATTYSDGSTTQDTNANVYTLILQNGTWKVQDDQQPDTRTLQPQPGDSGNPANPNNPGNSGRPGRPQITPTPVVPDAPTTVPPSGALPAPGAQSSGAPSASAVAAIKAVIQKANQEEVQAFTSNDPSVMSDTATSSYYQQMAQNYTDMANSGITSIQLVNLTWGPVTLQDANTAQANTTETWATTYSDGSTTQDTNANVYTLVLQNGAWKVQDDQQPDTRTLQPQPGNSGNPANPSNPGAAPTPVAPPATNVDQSSNWAGYAATGGTFTAVSGTWTVPQVAAGSGNSVAADATWVGIGGVDTTDLIQAGTQAVVQSGQVEYSAWVETLPQASQTVPLDVNAGDSISVSITEQTSGNWQIVIRDLTTGQSYQKSLAYRSSLSSAEWIEESPTAGRGELPLDNFGTVTFTKGVAVEDGQQRTIAQAGGQPITMSGSATQGRRGRFGQPGAQAGQNLAQPSNLGSDGSSFSVTRTGSNQAPVTVP